MMRYYILVLMAVALGSSFSSAEPHGGGGPGGHPGGAPHSVFPAYPKYNPPKGAHAQAHAPAPALHEDHLGNRVTDDHINRVEFAHQRGETVMRQNAHVVNHVNYHSANFAGTLHPIYDRKRAVYVENFNHFHDVVVAHPAVWNDWHAHSFYGGFYYGFHPIPDMSIYFYNPLVHWFYIGTWDDAYYRTWYAQEYSAYPDLNKPFPYYGLYYPTDNLKQLLFGVSAMPVDKQARFREGMITMTKLITQQLANYTHQHVTLSNGDLVITHYENLGTDDGVDVEGAITYQNKPYNFKGMINLDENVTPQVFVTGNGETAPSAAQLSQLDALNQQINAIRGDQQAQPVQAPNTASDTPYYPPNPSPTIPPGEVSADPVNP